MMKRKEKKWITEQNLAGLEDELEYLDVMCDFVCDDQEHEAITAHINATELAIARARRRLEIMGAGNE